MHRLKTRTHKHGSAPQQPLSTLPAPGALIPHPAPGSGVPRGSEMPRGLHAKLQSEMQSPALPPNPCGPDPSVPTGSRTGRAPAAQLCLQKAREKPSRILTVRSTAAQTRVCPCRRESAQVGQPWTDGQRTEGEAEAVPPLPLPSSGAAERGELAETHRDPRQRRARAGSEPLCFISLSCRERLIHLFIGKGEEIAAVQHVKRDQKSQAH